MNIHDVKDIPHVEPEDYIDVIFHKQTALLKKYKEIEGIPDYPFDIDGAQSQVWMKDFLWRTVEEIAESMEAKKDGHKVHQIEELSDALHFITEALILAGVKPKCQDLTELEKDFNTAKRLLTEYKTSYENACLQVMYWAGMTGNTLKNKPWKQTQMQTDFDKFASCLRNTFDRVLLVFFASGCTAEEIYVYYFKKSEVNKFRQESKY